MNYVLTQIIWASATAFLFVLVSLAFRRKTAARPLYLLGWILALSFILPVKLPLLRVEIPESKAQEMGYTGGFSEETVVFPYVPDMGTENTETESTAPSVSAPTLPAQTEKESEFPTETAILAIYVFGVFTTLFCTFFRYCRAVKSLQRCGRAPREREKRVFTEICEKQGVSRVPRLLVCPQNVIGSSVMFGFKRQNILIADNLKEEDFALILGHELTHCKRKDQLFKAVLALLGALYWFNPIIHLFIRTMNNLCEESCDEKFLSGSSYESKLQYCRLLIATATIKKAENKALFTTFKGGSKAMKRRLENILNKKSKVIAAVLVVSVLLVTMLTSAIYFTLPPNNVKVAYLDSWDKVWTSLDESDTLKSDYDVEYQYSINSDEITVTGIVNGNAFDVTGKLVSRNHNGAKIFYEATDAKGNYDVRHLSIQLAQPTEFESPEEGVSWNHTLKAFFGDYAKSHTKYKNALLLYLNPIGTDDIVVIEIFFEEDFVTAYSTQNEVPFTDEREKHLNWFVYWYADNGAFDLSE